MKNAFAMLAAALLVAPGATLAQDAGIYAGIQAGNAEIDVDGGLEVDGDGTSFGAFVGYMVENGGLVYGGELDYDTTEYDIADGTASVDSTTRLKGRVGVASGPGLLYGTAGLVWATSPELGDDNGIFYGAGYDFPVTTNIDLGVEVLGHEFDDYNDSGLDVGVTTVKARLTFNF